MAKDFDVSLIDVLCSKPESALQIAQKVRTLVAPWQGGQVSGMSVAAIREEFVSRASLKNRISGLSFNLDDLDALQVRVKRCPQHRDLHGLNVLLKNKTEPLLIDFGEVGIGSSCIDALVMELSLVFHPSCRGHWGRWPTKAHAERWDDVNAFTADCPIAPFIKFCRKWALDVAAGDKEVYITACCFALRQLKFDKTDHDLAIAIANACYRRLISEGPFDHFFYQFRDLKERFSCNAFSSRNYSMPIASIRWTWPTPNLR